MKSKYLSMFALTMLSLALFISSASALTLSSSPSSITFSELNQSSIITLSGDSPFNITSLTYNNISSPGSASFSVVNTTPINNISSANFNVSLANFNSGNFVYGSSYPTQLQFIGVNSSNSTLSSNASTSLSYVKTFCQNGDLNDTNLQMYISISNSPSGVGTSSSSSMTSWNPLDTITVQVTLDNQNSNFNLNNVNFDIGLFQQGTNGNVIGNMVWSGGSYNSYSYGTIGSNSDGQATFTFKINPQLISTQGSGSYYLMVRAYGNQFCIDHSSNLDDSFGNSFISGGYAEDISVNQPNYNNAVIIDTTSLPATTQVQCGQSVTLTPTVYNLGSSGNSYSSNQILVTLTNPALGLNLNQTIYGGLSSGQSQSVPFTFTVPLNATQGIQTLYFRTYYGYNQNNNYGILNNYQYESQNTFNTYLNIEGGCVYATPGTTQVTAQLESGGKSGNPLVIQATITNTGAQTVNYNFGLEGYSSWASLSDINPLNVTIGPGQSQTVTTTLNVNNNADGNYVFYLDTYSNSYLISKQPLTISITPSFGLSSITGGLITQNNWYLWAVGLFNVILVVVIIIVLVKISKRRK